MHGGAADSGNRNAFKHRLYAGADWAHVADLRSLIADCERFISTQHAKRYAITAPVGCMGTFPENA